MIRSILIYVRRLLERAERWQSQRDLSFPPVSAGEVIKGAIQVDDHFDRLELLTAWNEGDWRTVRSILSDAEFHNWVETAGAGRL